MVAAEFLGSMEAPRDRHTSDIGDMRGLLKVGAKERVTRPVLAALDEQGRRTSDLTDVQGVRGLSRNSILEKLQAMGEAVDSDDESDAEEPRSPYADTPYPDHRGRPTFRSRANSEDLFEDKEHAIGLESLASTRPGSEYLSQSPPTGSPSMGYLAAPTPEHQPFRPLEPPSMPWRHGHEVTPPPPFVGAAPGTPPMQPATPPLVQVPDMVPQAANFATLQAAQAQLQREMAAEVEKLQRMQFQLQQMQVQQMQIAAGAVVQQMQAQPPVGPMQMPLIQVLMPPMPPVDTPTASPHASPPEVRRMPAKKNRRDARGPSELRDDVTLMLRNIPNRYTPAELLADLPAYRAFIDFFYLPTDFRNNCNLGFAFLNFTSGAAAAQFKAEHEGRKLPRFECSQKECVVETSRVQGLHANVDKFRNSSVMGVLDEDARPMVFRDGMRVAFPLPTVSELPAPGERRRRRNPLPR